MIRAAVISFCTNDYRFLDAAICAVRPIAEQIIVPVCDHFYNGDPENYPLLDWIYAQYPDCLFVEYQFDPEHLYGSMSSIDSHHPHYIHHWHNTSRLVAYYFLKEEVKDILFLDGDEVFETARFQEWDKQFSIGDYSALRFSAYYYFREARYQALSYGTGPILVKKNELKPEHLLDSDERMGAFFLVPGKRMGNVGGMDGKPLVHHFSWVRTKQEMLHKTRTWGHHWERDWEALIEEEFSKGFQGKDFIAGHEYRQVDPWFDPFTVKMPRLTKQALRPSFPHVERVTPQDIFRKDLLLSLN